MIDWTNPSCRITPCLTFTVQDALWLRGEKKLADIKHVNEVHRRNLVGTFMTLAAIVEAFHFPIPVVTSAFRTREYNHTLPGAAKRSYHMVGRAVDFVIPGIECDQVRELLLPVLELYQIRMEDRPGSDWVHIDTGDVIFRRFFKP